MFYHNLLLTFRNFKRHKSTFLINLIGLSAGLACALLVYLWVSDEYSMDQFHANQGRLYQVMANHESSEGIQTIEPTPDLLAETLAAEMPEVESATSYLPAELIPMKFILSAREDQKVKGVGQFAAPGFFQVFSYPLVQGNAAQVLERPDAVVLSEKMATALFQSPENAIGKSIQWQLTEFKRTCTVTGVFKNLPANSSNQFDFVLTIQSFRDPSLFRRSIHWDNHAPTSIVVLKKGTDAAAFSQKIAGFIQSKFAESKVSLFLRPYGDRYLYDQYEGGKLVGGHITTVRLFSLIAVFILLIACINFMNLSTARASLRMKEVGIKKAIGISRAGLALQFLGESVVLTFLSLLVAMGWVVGLTPQFNAITGKSLDLLASADWVGPFAGIALLAGLLAGSYPALYLSGFQPVAMLRGRLKRNAGELWSRKGLVVLQFGISISFIIAVMVVYQQIKLVQTKKMGYNREQVIHFGREGNLGPGLDVFLSELKALPGVVEAAGMQGDFIGENSFTIGLEWPGKQANETVTFSNLSGSYRLIETLGIEMAEGRSFSKEFGSDSTDIIFTEAAIAAMHLQNPIGQTVKLWGNDYHIIGVAKDFHLKSLREPIKPAFFKLDAQGISSILVQLEPGQEGASLDRIQQLYAKANPGYAFEYAFLNDDFQKQYVAENRLSVLSRYFAGLAILLSCLGLFGLASFSAEQRRKEIGVRKVLGASAGSVLALLSKDFLLLVVISFVLAAPVAHYFMSDWLAQFSYRIELQWWVFGLAGLAGLCIAFLTVSFQSLRAAWMNPVSSLRSE